MRPSCTFLVALVVLLALDVAAQVDNECSSRCDTSFDSCITRNTVSKEDCRVLKNCNSSNTNCDEACKQACAWCDNYWGHFIESGCDLDRITCYSRC